MVFMLKHFVPFVQVEHGPLPRGIYEQLFVFLYANE